MMSGSDVAADTMRKIRTSTSLSETGLPVIAKLEKAYKEGNKGERNYYRSDDMLAQFAAWQPEYEKN